MQKATRVIIDRVNLDYLQNLLTMPTNVLLYLASLDFSVLLAVVHHDYPHLDHLLDRYGSSGR